MTATKVRSAAARRAWQTRSSANYRAAKAELRSKDGLRDWAKASGFHVLLLDAPSGRPRTGIIDALLIRHTRTSADALEIFAVQLKGGGGGLTPREMSRLVLAAGQIRALPLVILHDKERLHFLPAEPEERARRRRRKR